MKWSARETEILRLLIRRKRDENWRPAKLLEEATPYFPERSRMAVKEKIYQMIKRREA